MGGIFIHERGETMLKTIDITKPQTIAIGYIGENDALTLQFLVPDDYANGDIYLDFMLPNGLTTQTPKLIDGTFVVPNEFLTVCGRGKCDVIYRSDGVKQVIGRLEVAVRDAINADGTLVLTYKDVIQDALQRVADCEEMARSVRDDANAGLFKGDTGDQGSQGPKGDKGNVMFATFSVDILTGLLTVTTPDEYSGAIFSINQSGILEVSI
jgi:hypothetical protein